MDAPRRCASGHRDPRAWSAREEPQSGLVVVASYPLPANAAMAPQPSRPLPADSAFISLAVTPVPLLVREQTIRVGDAPTGITFARGSADFGSGTVTRIPLRLV
jgi:hypothetical protein